MSDVLTTLFRHKTWSTLRLIEHCQSLSDEFLDATIPGTYGTIRDTLRHLVEAEEGYLFILTGERLFGPLPPGAALLEELAKRIRGLGPRWEALVHDADIPNREFISRDGWRMLGVVPMAEAIHHADDHRSHVLSILGAHGLEVPDLDVWSYAESARLMQPIDSGTPERSTDDYPTKA